MSTLPILFQCAVHFLNVWLTFFVTLSCFPAMQVNVQMSEESFFIHGKVSWHHIYIDQIQMVSCWMIPEFLLGWRVTSDEVRHFQILILIFSAFVQPKCSALNNPRLEQTTSSAPIFSKTKAWMGKYTKKSCSYYPSEQCFLNFFTKYVFRFSRRRYQKSKFWGWMSSF
jgi:hypothetical protein